MSISGYNCRTNMFSQRVSYIACSLIGVATSFLALGTLLIQAATLTGAVSDYSVHVTWFSVLGSVVRSPNWLSVLLLFGIFLLAIITWLTFFRAPRGIGVAVLFLQAVVAGFCCGGLGWFFILREFNTYHFTMDGEKLGEHWFFYESVAFWMLAVGTLGVIRLFARKHLAVVQAQ
jgi:hypothetical protein